jgi:hypothetical protein
MQAIRRKKNILLKDIPKNGNSKLNRAIGIFFDPACFPGLLSYPP